MSAVAQPRRRSTARASAAVAQPVSEAATLRATLVSLSDLAASGAPSDGDPRDAMRHLAARACEAIGIARCGVFVRDEARELFVGCAAHPGADLEAAVQQLVLGRSTDRITREILTDRKPVLIRDAGSDPRALTAVVRAWKVRSLLGVPMIAGDEVLGVLMFDNGDSLHRFAPLDVEIATAFASFGAATLAAGRHCGGLRTSLDTATRQNRLLRRTAVAEHRLADAILGGGGLGAIVEVVSGLTGKPSALYDAHGQVIASSVPESSELEVTLLRDAAGEAGVRAGLDEVMAGASITVEPILGGPIRRRHLVAPVDVRDERWGWLVIVEHPGRLAAFDDFLLRRAATHLALELAGRRQTAASGADGRSELAGRLVGGAAIDDDLRRQAEYLGVGIDTHRVIAYVDAPPGTFNPEAIAHAVAGRTATDVLVTAGPDGGVVLLIEVGRDEAPSAAVRRVQGCLRQALGELGLEQRFAGLSAVCRAGAEFAGGYRMARQVARCIENVPSSTGPRVLAACDLGPGRLFVANTRPEEMHRFVEDVLGTLLDDDEACAGLLRTLEAFYETGRSVRLASERLGVHENTVRYRLSRVHVVTGLDVAGDADDQLSVQVALLVLRLEGHPGVRPFEEIAAG